MKIIEWKKIKSVPQIPATVSIGVFDAFHSGHQTLAAAAFAESQAAVRVAVTFRKLPKSKGRPVYPFSMRLDDLEACGFDEAVVIDFNKAFADLSAAAFFARLEQRYRLLRLTVGTDFRCGRQRSSSAADLKLLLPQTEIRSVMLNDGDRKVSASDIKRCLREGRPEEANSVLVRPYRLPFRWCGRRFAVRRRSGLTVLANGRYKVEIGGQEQTAEVKGAFVRFEREILVKKPMEIVILSKEKE